MRDNAGDGIASISSVKKILGTQIKKFQIDTTLNRFNEDHIPTYRSILDGDRLQNCHYFIENPTALRFAIYCDGVTLGKIYNMPAIIANKVKFWNISLGFGLEKS